MLSSVASPCLRLTIYMMDHARQAYEASALSVGKAEQHGMQEKFSGI
jgi:hypothetical protein